MMRQAYTNPGGPSSPRPRSLANNGALEGFPTSSSSSSPKLANSYTTALQGQSTRSAQSPVSLEAWGQGLLGTRQLDSVQRLSEVVKKAERSRYQGDCGVRGKAEEVQLEQAGPGQTAISPHLLASSSSIALPIAPITSSSALLQWLESVKNAETSPTTIGTGRNPSHTVERSHTVALAQMQSAVEQTTDLLTQLEQARINVAELLAGVKSVEETSEELREESEKRGGRAESLLALAQELDVYLSYYNLLPQATTFLSSPSLGLVLTPTFSLTLVQLDLGLSFIRAHPHFKDSSLYRLRFEHCITRGGNLAKMWICGRLRELKEEAVGRLREREKSLKGAKNAAGQVEAEDAVKELPGRADLMDFSSPSVLQILYSEFVAASPELSSVLCEVQKRCPTATASAPTTQAGKLPTDEDMLLADYSHSDAQEEGATNADDDQRNINTFVEFNVLLTDIRNAYCDARRSILAPLIAHSLSKIETRAQNNPGNLAPDTAPAVHSPLLTFTASSLILQRSLLLSEASLYRQVFGEGDTAAGSPGESALIDFLRSLGKDFMDRLHPRVFAESKVTTLAALLKVVLSSCSGSTGQNEAMHSTAAPAYLFFSSQDPYTFSDHPTDYGPLTSTEEVACLIKPLVFPLIKDIQTRLLYRSRAVLSGGDIAGYSPRGTGEELIELVKRIVRGDGMSEEKKGTVVLGRRGKRGRSSLGVGILKAAAERALQESQQEEVGHRRAHDLTSLVAGHGVESSSLGTSTPSTLAPPTPHDGSPPRSVPSIELFRAPPPQVLATWYLPLVRAFTILSLLHPVMTREDFVKVGNEALEKVRGAVVKGNEILRNKVAVIAASKEKQQQKTIANDIDGDRLPEDEQTSTALPYEPDELDSAMFDLRNALLLRELSASVDLSRVQPSRYDWLEERVGGGGTGRQKEETATSRGLLDVGAVLKAMAGLFESNTTNGGEGPVGDGEADDDGSSPPSHPSSVSSTVLHLLSSDVSRSSSHLVGVLRSKLPPADGTSHAWLEEVVITLRFIRRRIALYIEDDQVVTDLLRTVIDSATRDQGNGHVEGKEERQEAKRIKERLGL